jgi:hypothetical protein
LPVFQQTVKQHILSRQATLRLLQRLGTTAEEWFRVELLSVFDALEGITINATNQRIGDYGSRPDFSLSVQNRCLLIELKVLPQDPNYQYGWQRFLAGPNNKRDFEKLVRNERQGIIYIHWPAQSDWQACRRNLESNYAAQCLREDSFALGPYTITLSYWTASSGHKDGTKIMPLPPAP